MIMHLGHAPILLVRQHDNRFNMESSETGADASDI